MRIGLLTQRSVDRNQRSAFHDKIGHSCAVSRDVVKRSVSSNPVLYDLCKKIGNGGAVLRSVSREAAL